MDELRKYRPTKRQLWFRNFKSDTEFVWKAVIIFTVLFFLLGLFIKYILTQINTDPYWITFYDIAAPLVLLEITILITYIQFKRYRVSFKEISRKASWIDEIS